MLRWLPWKYVVSRIARARGLVDPVKILSKLESFAQPLEVKEPLELLRAGMVFHARGLLNTGAIQHNLDWVWPYWVERQYDPLDESFIPRAFSITHVNLTHRNWTAVGLPDLDELPVVDPRGLVTPFWDSWSLDAWVLGDDGSELVPSRLEEVAQTLETDGTVAVVTHGSRRALELTSRAEVLRRDGVARLRLLYEGASEAGGWLVVGLRPYNPEGVSFVHRIESRQVEGAPVWEVDGEWQVELAETPARQLFSRYRQGDVYEHLRREVGATDDGVSCKVGMATAAALYRLEPARPRLVEVTVPLEPKKRWRRSHGSTAPSWQSALAGSARLRVPDSRLQFLWDAAVRTLVLHSPEEVYPGPYTYRRFWFRDATFILYGLLVLGMTERVERTLDLFPSRQTRAGHFLSQEGEWDSNGEALWILERFCALTGRAPKEAWRRAVGRGGRWIARKRVERGGDAPHAGLLPAGFSAEHLGPNDYYYWDDFWGVSGLRSAGAMLDAYGDAGRAEAMRHEADDLAAAIDRSLEGASLHLGSAAMPASPYRRLDSGAIGSIAAGYPLQLFPERDPRLLDTVEFFLDECFAKGAFFQDMIHSGINPYLTLHIAQVLQRAGDPRAWRLITRVAELASPTGQWPEAIHPRTGGGCMGDGQHAWAAAEWILALRNAFVREEGEALVLGGGVPAAWVDSGEEISFGPTPTSFGPVSVSVAEHADGVEICWEGAWRGDPPPIRVRLAGFAEVTAPADATGVVLTDDRVTT